MLKTTLAKKFFLFALSLFSTFLLSCAAYANPRASYDYNGDSREDVLLWDSSLGIFTAVNSDGTAVSFQCGLPGDTPLTGNVITKNRGEAVVWRPGSSLSLSSFFICGRGQAPIQIKLGVAGDIPFGSEDFDGDGLADLTVWRPSTREWIKSLSSGSVSVGQGKLSTFVFGEEGDIPVPADYDGNGISQEAIFRPKTADWYILNANRIEMTIKQWGLPDDIPVPADYDGDGLADIAVWRPDNGAWYVIPSSSPQTPWVVSLGLPGDIPMPREINGDGKIDFVIFRPSTGEIFLKTSTTDQTSSLVVNAQYAQGTNVLRESNPINDFDGDGLSDAVVVRKTNGYLHWISKMSSNPVETSIQWGLDGDLPLASDYTGDNQTDYAIVRNNKGSLNWLIRPSDNSLPYSIVFGFGGDTVFTSNCDSDKKADPTVVRTNTSSDFTWYSLSSLTGGTVTTTWGHAGDQIAIGDFDGDELSDPTVVRAVAGELYWFTKTLDGKQLAGVRWGFPSDTLVPADYDGDGRSDYAILRNTGGKLYLFIRTSSGLTPPPIRWGYAGDAFVAGNYRGGLKLQAAIWRANSSGQFSINNSPWRSYKISLGVKGDTPLGLLLPQIAPGSPPKTVTSPVTTTSRICDVSLPNTDGPDGFVHKPVSDSDGKLAIILNKKFKGQTTKLELLYGSKRIETLVYAGDFNGDRPTFRAQKTGSDYANNLTERWTTTNGKKYCIKIPNPEESYD